MMIVIFYGIQHWQEEKVFVISCGIQPWLELENACDFS